MKKILSLFLVAAMLLSLIPSVFAADAPNITIKYNINSLFTANETDMTVFTEAFTSGFYRYNSHTGIPKMQGGRSSEGNRTLEVPNGTYLTFDVYVPVAGNYTISGTHPHFTGGGTITVSVVKNGTEVEWGKYNSAYITGVHTAKDQKKSYGNNEDISTEITTSFPFDKGWNSIKFAASNGLGCVRTFTLTLGNGSGATLMPYLNGNTTLKIGESATLKGFLSSTATEATVTYSASSDCVTVGTDGTITAVKPGKATVTMTASDSTVVAANPYTVEITVPAPAPEEDEDLTNAFDDADVGFAPSDYVAPSVDAIDANGIEKPVPVSGGAYKITAAETSEGKGNFLYWKKAMTVNEKIVSFEREFNYVPEGNERNILVAVYEGDVKSADPKCYNANGQYLPDAEPIEADLPSMAGYGKADKWEQYGDTNVYVAHYETETPIADIDVIVSGENTSGGGENLAYGAPVTCTATGENFKCWMKTYGDDDTAKIVSTEAEYTFKAWEDCTVEAIYEENVHYTGSKMKIIIDSFTAGDETGVMAEFLGFDNNVVEKGIMFEGNRIAMTTVGNQFSIIADEEGTYKGYVIVNADDSLKLITDGLFTVQAGK